MGEWVWGKLETNRLRGRNRNLSLSPAPPYLFNFDITLCREVVCDIYFLAEQLKNTAHNLSSIGDIRTVQQKQKY